MSSKAKSLQQRIGALLTLAVTTAWYRMALFIVAHCTYVLVLVLHSNLPSSPLANLLYVSL